MSELQLRIESDGPALDGRLHLPDGAARCAGVVVCHPHPQHGGDMENNVVTALCRALVQRGIAALRFNFRGVGASAGSYDEGRGEADDTRAALGGLLARPEIDPARAGLAGYSFGALMSQAVADERLRALALVAPPVRALDVARLNGFGGALLVMAGDRDPIAPEGPLRDVLGGLTRPLELRIVAGADHSWWGHERELEELAGTFFAEHLAASEGM